MFKMDTECSYGRFSAGITARYYTNIENIDRAFMDFIPGVKNYIKSQPPDNWIVDLRFGCEIRDGWRGALVIRNLFNEEFMTRPADIQAPRSFTISFTIKI